MSYCFVPYMVLEAVEASRFKQDSRTVEEAPHKTRSLRPDPHAAADRGGVERGAEKRAAF